MNDNTIGKSNMPKETLVCDEKGLVLLTLELLDKNANFNDILASIREVCSDLIRKWTGKKIIFIKGISKKKLILKSICIFAMFISIYQIIKLK